MKIKMRTLKDASSRQRQGQHGCVLLRYDFRDMSAGAEPVSKQQCDHRRLLRNHILNLIFCPHWTCKEKNPFHSGGKAHVMWTAGAFSSGQSQRPWEEAFASTLDLERREESSLHAPTRYKETMGPRDWASETNWDFLKSHLCSIYTQAKLLLAQFINQDALQPLLHLLNTSFLQSSSLWGNRLDTQREPKKWDSCPHSATNTRDKTLRVSAIFRVLAITGKCRVKRKLGRIKTKGINCGLSY